MVVGFQFIEGDTYTDGRLEQIRYVTQKNYAAASRAVTRYESYAKYGLPGYHFELLRVRMRWEELGQSLINIDKAIAAGQGIKDRPQDIITNES